MSGARELRCALALALAMLAFPAGAAALPGDPDLVADPPSEGELEVFSEGSTQRLLLRFDGFVHNTGSSALEFRASDPSGLPPVMHTIFQRINGVNVPSPAQVRFEPEDGHDHFHLKDVARYSLWNVFRTAEVAPAMKVGFCLEDTEPVDSDAVPSPTPFEGDQNPSFCESGNPGASSVLMGVSRGWRDVYDRGLAFQWVDVSAVQPGIYWLRSEVDPDGVVRESQEANAPAFGEAASTIPGYVAQPVTQQISPGASVNVALRATSIGDVGPLRFRIDRPPACGDLDRAAGTWFTATTVRYTPRPGCSGSDSFEYSARDASSAFPTAPARASAQLMVPAAPSVAISGAPARLATGASAQLTATVANASPAVVWSVDGVAGGNSTVGRITAAGRYTAPSAVPPRRFVEIGARSPSGAGASVRIEIVKAAAPRPSIRPSTRVALRGRTVLVRTVPKRTVKIGVKVKRGRSTVGRCRTALVRAGRSHVCRAKVRRGVRLTRLKVVVTMRVRGRTISNRVLSVPRPRSARHHH